MYTLVEGWIKEKCDMCGAADIQLFQYRLPDRLNCSGFIIADMKWLERPPVGAIEVVLRDRWSLQARRKLYDSGSPTCNNGSWT